MSQLRRGDEDGRKGRPYDHDWEHQASEEARINADPPQSPSTAIPFDPLPMWYEKPANIAKTLRFLKLIDKEPADIADFIEHCDTPEWGWWYRQMVMWSGGDAA